MIFIFILISAVSVIVFMAITANKTSNFNSFQTWENTYQDNQSVSNAIKKTLKSFAKFIGGRYLNYQVNGNLYNQPVKLTYQMSDIKTVVYELQINPIITSDLSMFTSYKHLITGDISLDKLNKIFTHKDLNVIGHFDKNFRSKLSKSTKYINKIIIINTSTIFEINDSGILSDENILKNLFDLSKQVLSPFSIYKKILNNVKKDPNEKVREENLKTLFEYNNYLDYLNELKNLQNDNNINISLIIKDKLKILNEKSLLGHLKNIKNSNTQLRFIKWIDDYLEKKNIFEYAHRILPYIDKNIFLEYLIKLIKVHNNISTPYLIELIENNKLSINDFNLHIELIKFFTYLKVDKAYEWIESELFHFKDEIKLQAVKAMKKIGTINSVEKLQKLTDKKYSDRVRSEALDAISLIQSGIPDETKGSLMLAENDLQGKLSLENQIGHLSNIEEKE